MYVLLFLLLLFGAFLLALHGVRRGKRSGIVNGVFLAVLTFAFFGFMDFWGEMLWFANLGYAGRFWKTVWAVLGFSLSGLIAGGIVVFLLTLALPRERKLTRIWSIVGGGIIGLLWGLAHWETLWVYLNRVSTELADPVLHKTTSFYLFTLPFYDSLQMLLLLLTLFVLAVVFFTSLDYSQGGIDFEQLIRTEGDQRPVYTTLPFRPLYFAAAVLLVVIAAGKYLDRYHLMYSAAGIVTGAGWTDVHIRLPMYSFVSFVCLVLAAVLLVPALRNRLQRLVLRLPVRTADMHLLTLGGVAGVLIVVWFLFLTVVPQAFQWLRVEPNELALEQPYIAHNIKFTRYGFDLEKVQERQFPMDETFTEDLVERNQNIFDNIRLWDWRALNSVYEQFQEIRLYYEFSGMDIDRYTFNGTYREVMLSAREMEQDNLAEQSKTFVNKRFKYTHGYGIAMNKVSEFTPAGLPDLLIKDIPPRSRFPELEVERPEIYYGELTDSHVFVNTRAKEFDYPKGEQNAYINYPGTGGVQLSNIWRKFLFGWKFDGTKLLLSNYPTSESRVMFHRQIRDRVENLAPFLQYGDDPYIVLADGKLYWIIDAYTTSDSYPYSENFSTRGQAARLNRRTQQLFLPQKTSYIAGANYVRNSVKVVVDAFSGEVDYYIYDEDDPIIRVWDSIFPKLLQPKSAMPERLRSHVRYPADFLLLQGMVYSKYHMTDPGVFYNQEDLWVRATEKYHNRVQPVEPYYVMWERPGSDEPEFVLIMPYTPKNRQVLIGWIAGMCDGENYGRLLTYKFPKDKRVLGPQQVETKIDQNSYLSEQLTLWDQRGSNVLRGNVLAIPVEDTLLYVEPIYLQAETSAYPELRLVVTMHGDNLSYAETFDEALKGLYKEKAKPKIGKRPARPGVERTARELIQRANQAFKDYLRLQHEMQFGQASKELDELHRTLQKLMQQTRQEKAPQGGQ
jgi:hypothetical protein